MNRDGSGRQPTRQPSGEQYAIVWGDSVAHISQVGATLRTFTVAGRDVIDGFPSDERSSDGRGQVLAPWPNRLTDGSYTYRGRDCQAPLDSPAATTRSTGWCAGWTGQCGART